MSPWLGKREVKTAAYGWTADKTKRSAFSTCFIRHQATTPRGREERLWVQVDSGPIGTDLLPVCVKRVPCGRCSSALLEGAPLPGISGEEPPHKGYFPCRSTSVLRTLRTAQTRLFLTVTVQHGKGRREGVPLEESTFSRRGDRAGSTNDSTGKKQARWGLP